LEDDIFRLKEIAPAHDEVKTTYRPDLRKYAVTTWAPATGRNWTMQKIAMPGPLAPWIQDGKTKQQSRDYLRCLLPMGDECWNCFLRRDKKVYYRHMSLPEVWDHLKEIWGSADKANDDLVPLHFWKVMVRRYGEGTDLMIEMSYNVLARLDELSYDINVELFKDIMSGEIHPSMRAKWVTFLYNMKNSIANYTELRHGGRNSLDKALDRGFKEHSPTKTEDRSLAVRAAAAMSMRDIITGEGYDKADDEMKGPAVSKLFDIEFKVEEPYIGVIDLDLTLTLPEPNWRSRSLILAS